MTATSLAAAHLPMRCSNGSIDTGGDWEACDALLRGFGIVDWVETALKKEVQIRHPKEEVGVLARNEQVRYRVWIEHDGCRWLKWRVSQGRRREA